MWCHSNIYNKQYVSQCPVIILGFSIRWYRNPNDLFGQPTISLISIVTSPLLFLILLIWVLPFFKWVRLKVCQLYLFKEPALSFINLFYFLFGLCLFISNFIFIISFLLPILGFIFFPFFFLVSLNVWLDYLWFFLFLEVDLYFSKPFS